MNPASYNRASAGRGPSAYPAMFGPPRRTLAILQPSVRDKTFGRVHRAPLRPGAAHPTRSSDNDRYP